MRYLFWLSLISVFYTYMGYLLILFIMDKFAKKKAVKRFDFKPSVSMIIAAYNEEKSIGAKIENSINLAYPKGLLDIIVVSDCSGDKTDEIVRNYANKYNNVRLLRLKKRSGKTIAQNEAVKAAKGDILVFSDATTEYDTNAVSKLVTRFSDEKICCVGGRLVFMDTGEESALLTQKNLYELLEQYIRTAEANIDTTFGIDGCIYAVRRELYKPLDGTLTSDFVLPLTMLENGYKIAFEKDAVAYEEVSADNTYELKRKIRTVRAGITGLFHMRSLLNPMRFGFWMPFGLLSHKVLRWMSPFFLIALLVSNLFLLDKPFYINMFLIQAVIYLSAALGYAYRQKKTPKFFSIPMHFCLLNIAALIGYFEFLKGKRTEIWDTTRG